MDNQETIPQSLELPRPQTDALPIPSDESPEFGAYQEQKTVSAAGPDPGMSAQTSSSVQAIVGGTSSTIDPVVVKSSHIAASDIDLIEKEWVQKAKAIVAHTHGDPYTQNKEINKIKADYIKKRYNKDIKQVSE